MPKCKSHLTQVMKRAKALSVWPEHDQANQHPVCGGDISIDIGIEGGGRCYCGDYCYCDGPSLKVYVTCSKCRNPFIDTRLQDSYPVSRINDLVEIGLAHEISNPSSGQEPNA